MDMVGIGNIDTCEINCTRICKCNHALANTHTHTYVCMHTIIHVHT